MIGWDYSTVANLGIAGMVIAFAVGIVRDHRRVR